MELLQDIAHNITQYLPHPKKPLGNAPYGYVSERINMTDWEGPESIGYILPISTWAETSLMLTTVEIPGLYVQPGKSYFIPFDNVEVKVIADTRKKFELSVTNPTPVDALISVYEDKCAVPAKRMDENLVLGLQKIELKSDETKKIVFRKP